MSAPIVIPLPWARPPLSQNDRDERKRGGARKIAEAKDQARWAIRGSGVRPIVGANVTTHWRIPDRRRRDSDNLGALHKVIQDALVLEGVLPDDSWVCIPRAAQHIHEPNGEPAAIWVELSDVVEYEVQP